MFYSNTWLSTIFSDEKKFNLDGSRNVHFTGMIKRNVPKSVVVGNKVEDQ